MALSQGEPADDWICGFVPCRSGGVPRIQRKRKRPIYELCRQRRKPIWLYIPFYLVRKPQKSPLTVSVGLIPLFWDSYDYDEQNHCHPQISAVGADARRYSSVHSTPRDL